MALSNTVKVAMPKEKITFKKGKGDVVYVYYTPRSYRRKSDNKPTSDEVSICKKYNRKLIYSLWCDINFNLF